MRCSKGANPHTKKLHPKVPTTSCAEAGRHPAPAQERLRKANSIPGGTRVTGCFFSQALGARVWSGSLAVVKESTGGVWGVPHGHADPRAGQLKSLLAPTRRSAPHVLAAGRTEEAAF